jgi:hypothetical protein
MLLHITQLPTTVAAAAASTSTASAAAAAAAVAAAAASALLLPLPLLPLLLLLLLRTLHVAMSLRLAASLIDLCTFFSSNWMSAVAAAAGCVFEEGTHTSGAVNASAQNPTLVCR